MNLFVSIYQAILSNYLPNNSFVVKLSRFLLDNEKQYLDWFLIIKDRDLRKDFHAYSITRRSFIPMIIFAFFYTFFIIPQEIVVVQDSVKHFEIIFQAYEIIFLCFQILVSLSVWGFIFLRKIPSLLIYDRVIVTSFIVTCTITINLYLIRSIIYPCHAGKIAEYIISRDCSIKQPILPWDSGAYYIVPSIAYIVLLKETRFYLVLLSFSSTMITIGFLTYYFYPVSFQLIFFWTCAGILVLYELHIQNIRSFFLKRKLVETLVENEKMNEHNQAYEMRHMIANVAHDLKTVRNKISI